ncbi:Uncharacterised protein [Mycobacteroides abscessus subsp. abscessus]|nr:Uncharacterised protein [Mycobacteroides abscessus subsp. abscessus]
MLAGDWPVNAYTGSNPCPRSAEALPNSGSSSIGTPSMRQITATGSG